jgi:hypothetical protein
MTEQQATQVAPEPQEMAVLELHRPVVLERTVILQVVAAVIGGPLEMPQAATQAQEVLEVKEAGGKREVLAEEAVREVRVLLGTPAAVVAQEMRVHLPA